MKITFVPRLATTRAFVLGTEYKLEVDVQIIVRDTCSVK
jgi:hypothetical protein